MKLGQTLVFTPVVGTLLQLTNGFHCEVVKNNFSFCADGSLFSKSNRWEIVLNVFHCSTKINTPVKLTCQNEKVIKLKIDANPTVYQTFELGGFVTVSKKLQVWLKRIT